MIDDDEEDLDFFLQALKSIDPSVTLVQSTSAEKILEQLRKGKLPIPNIIIIDLDMPRMDGTEFLNTCKKIEPLANVPIIIYTDSNDRGLEKICIKLGASAFIQKPATWLEIVQVAKNVLSNVNGTES
jgi:CheY-like chemotaxis protein